MFATPLSAVLPTVASVFAFRGRTLSVAVRADEIYVAFLVVGCVAVFMIHFKGDGLPFPGLATTGLTAMGTCPEKIFAEKIFAERHIRFTLLRTFGSVEVLPLGDTVIAEGVVLPASIFPSRSPTPFAWRGVPTGTSPVSVHLRGARAVAVLGSSFFVGNSFLAVGAGIRVLLVDSFRCQIAFGTAVHRTRTARRLDSQS